MGLRFPPKSRRRAKSGRKRGAQPGHKGTTWKLVPIEQVKESYDIKPDVCSHWVCVGGQRCRAVSSPGDRNLAMVAEVTEYRLHTLTCSECGAETRAQLPTGVPQGDFSPRLQPMVSLLSGRYHLSKRDTVDIFFQANVSLGSVPALKQRTSEVIRVPVDEAREYVKRQPVVHMDETGWREANQKAWLWVAATTLVTVLIIRQSRGGKVAREMLGEAFKGIVVSDRWSAYNWLLTILRQLCWNHLLRDFQTFVDRGGESQAIGEAIPAQAASMFQWWHKVRDGTMSRAIFQTGLWQILGLNKHKSL